MQYNECLIFSNKNLLCSFISRRMVIGRFKSKKFSAKSHVVEKSITHFLTFLRKNTINQRPKALQKHFKSHSIYIFLTLPQVEFQNKVDVFLAWGTRPHHNHASVDIWCVECKQKHPIEFVSGLDGLGIAYWGTPYRVASQWWRVLYFAINNVKCFLNNYFSVSNMAPNATFLIFLIFGFSKKCL